ncbi:hypothetical protein FOCG_18605 [Fusarium oxysporum f. sp. radicis-lycopersici 26381]|nr:hypothetical protein FOCG_18605 [Fusarium oxysporum f. sp. radicis-lycopersici 26381]
MRSCCLCSSPPSSITRYSANCVQEPCELNIRASGVNAPSSCGFGCIHVS